MGIYAVLLLLFIFLILNTDILISHKKETKKEIKEKKTTKNKKNMKKTKKKGSKK